MRESELRIKAIYPFMTVSSARRLGSNQFRKTLQRDDLLHDGRYVYETWLLRSFHEKIDRKGPFRFRFQCLLGKFQVFIKHVAALHRTNVSVVAAAFNGFPFNSNGVIQIIKSIYTVFRRPCFGQCILDPQALPTFTFEDAQINSGRMLIWIA